MKKTLKNNQKSIRISDFTLTVVEGIEGEGFNNKFENMVYLYARKEKDLMKRIEALEREELCLTERVRKLLSVERDLKTIKNYVVYARELAAKTPPEGQLKIV